MKPGCDLIFHHDGQPISDYRKSWHTACVTNVLGAYYCRNCRDSEGRYLSVLDAGKKCPRCGKKWESPKYQGRLFHDFRRSCAHELWKAGSSAEDCMRVTGHKTQAMFKRYADLFSEEEIRARRVKFNSADANGESCSPAQMLPSKNTPSNKNNHRTSTVERGAG